MPSASKYILAALSGALFFIAAARLDLALRTRSAYLEGEKYAAWAGDTAMKVRAIDTEFAPRLKALENDLAAGRLDKSDFDDKTNLLLAEKKFRTGESAAKYAYIWYRTAAEDFSPPVTRHTLLARRKLPAALAAWEKEAGIKAK